MASKTVNIPIDEWFASLSSWLTNFFHTITMYETIAVGAIGVGFILLILGLILL